MIVSKIIKKQLWCGWLEQKTHFGGQQVKHRYFTKQYANRGNHSYQLAVSASLNQN